jgi:hypothetical protein
VKLGLTAFGRVEAVSGLKQILVNERLQPRDMAIAFFEEVCSRVVEMVCILQVEPAI